MRKFAKISAVLAAMVLALAFVSCKSDDDDDDENVLIDKTVEIPATADNFGYQYFDINLSKAATISVTVEVKSGDGVEIYAMDKSDLESFKKNPETVEYYPEFSSDTPTKNFSITASATAGHACFVLVNTSASAQTVYTKIVVK